MPRERKFVKSEPRTSSAERSPTRLRPPPNGHTACHVVGVRAKFRPVWDGERVLGRSAHLQTRLRAGPSKYPRWDCRRVVWPLETRFGVLTFSVGPISVTSRRWGESLRYETRPSQLRWAHRPKLPTPQAVAELADSSNPLPLRTCTVFTFLHVSVMRTCFYQNVRKIRKIRNERALRSILRPTLTDNRKHMRHPKKPQPKTDPSKKEI